MAKSRVICEQCGSVKYTLTQRQVEIVKHVAARPSATTKELAADLYLSPHTLKSHLNTVFKELGAGSRLECILICLQVGILELEDCLSD